MSGYEFTIFISCHPSDPRSIERAADFHLALDSMREVTLPDDAEVGALKWRPNRKVPASGVPQSPQEGAGAAQVSPTQAAPVADTIATAGINTGYIGDTHDVDGNPLPPFLDRKVPRR